MSGRIKRMLDRVWWPIKNQVVSRRHKRIATFWRPLIEDYFNGKIEKNNLLPRKKIASKVIWQYWGQGSGSELLPPTVQRCFDSVDKHKGDYQIIRLNNETVHDYIDFPEYVWGDNGDPKFLNVFFSDLLRLALLHVYGGVWLDATVLLTAPLPAEFEKLDYFVFQRSDQEPNKLFWAGPHTSYWSWDPRYRIKMLNSIIFAQKGSVVVATMLDLILFYWKSQNKIINYFFFQILYHELVNGHLENLQCPVVSDTLPHILRVLVDGNLGYMPLPQLLETVSIHKLTYFDRERLARLDDILRQVDQKFGSSEIE